MFFFFFFNDTATTEIYTLSLHDALPILAWAWPSAEGSTGWRFSLSCWLDRKSTRLNSSHVRISYAVFCLKKKKNALTNMSVFRRDRGDRALNRRRYISPSTTTSANGVRH